MLPVTFNGNPAFLITQWPDWSGGIQVTPTLPAMYERSLTGKETRRPTGDSLRLALKWTSLMQLRSLNALRNALQVLNVQAVLCPFWPGVFQAGTMPVVTASWYVLMDDTAAPSIQPASALGAGFARQAFPLMVGILADLPDPKLLNDQLATVEFNFKENDTSLLTPPAFDPADGPAAAAGTPPLWPFRPNWRTEPVAAGAEVDVTRQQIGQTRPLAQTYYTQPGRRRITQSYTLTGTDPFNLLSLYVSLGGQTGSFWLPASVSEANLTAAVGAADTVLQVDNGAALGTNTFIVLNDNINAAPLQVTGVSGNEWTLAAAPGTAFALGQTRIESLVLARLDLLKFTLTFVAPDQAAVTLKFKELPWELTVPAGETMGTTLGTLPETATLFVYTLTTPGSNELWYFTSFERNLVDGNGNTYVSVPMEYDKIVETPDLERQNVTVKSRNFAGSPLALLIPFELEWPLELAIYEANVSGNDATIVTCWFQGEVADVSLDGPVISANCESLSWIFDRSAARRLFQQTDNWNLFEPASGLTPADWQWNCVVVSYDVASATLVVGTITSGNSTPITANLFAAGYLQLTHAGAAVQYRMISLSTAVAGSHLTLSLSSPLTTAPSVGDAVAMFPGYDGTAPMCINTFDNYDNFGGFPFVPIGNPFVLKIQQPTGSGKK